MTEERVGDPDAKLLDKVVERFLRQVVPVTRALALTSSDLYGWRWRLHIGVSNMHGRSLDRITRGIWN